MSIPQELRDRLRALAHESVQHGVERGGPVSVRLDEWPVSLTDWQCSFVTLNYRSRLRGCIGALEATRPLVEDVAANAFAAAFRDPRFPPVSMAEYLDLDIHVSVLSPKEPISVSSEADLLDQLRPGVDGLVLEEGPRRGTFLPAVWRSLPEARDFLAQLKAKAGLPQDYWSDSLRIWRYTTEEF